jgi:hypothetical protein
MSNQQALASSADAQQQILTSQVNLFLFDLKNEASEHGFKADESWNLQMATEDEILGLKKQHHPLISLRLQPQALLQAYRQVKSKLQQSLSKEDMALTTGDLTIGEKIHLIAYPAKNPRSL